jgi:putative ABC transport system permease protein
LLDPDEEHPAMGWIRRLRSTLAGSNIDDEFDDEARFHLEQRTEEYTKSGMTPEEARREASRRLGNLTLAREQVHDVNTLRSLSDMGQDLRYALRQLRRNPGFALAAILTLAVGIGANTAIFSVVDSVLFRPLSYNESRRLVVIDEWIAKLGPIPVNGGHFQEWRRTSHSFHEMALVSGLDVNLTGSGEPERLPAARVSPALFPLLGVQPQFGRVFLDEEDTPGRDHVVVIGNDLWRRRYASDPQIVGRTIAIDGVPHEVVGVVPASFHFPKFSDLFPMTIVGDQQPQLWKPMALRPEELSLGGGFNFVSVARLKPGVSLNQAASELDAIEQALSAQAPPGGLDVRSHVLPLQDRIVGRVKTGMELTLAAVTIVLLIGCVNITNLLLARLSTRRRELAIRAAIGASRARLVRQMVVESLALSALGGASGICVAYGAMRLILAFAPATVPRLDEVQLDARVLLFTVTISTLAGLVIGLLPAWQFGKTNAGEALATGLRSTAGLHSGRVRSLAVSLEVALSAACLIASGLLLHSLVNLLNIDRGFDAQHIITVDLNLPPSRYPTPAKRAEFVRSALDRLETLPGATAVAVTNKLPLTGEGGNASLTIAGTTAPLLDRANGNIRTVNSDYFRAMGISLQAGRLFTDADRGQPVAVVGTSIATRAWRGRNPIGQRFHYGPMTNPDTEVVGIVNDVVGVSLDAGPALAVYVPYWQGFFSSTSFAVKTTADPTATSSAIRAMMHNIDPQLPLSGFRTMDDVVEGSISQRRFQTNLVILFAIAAILLAGLGVYGVLSYAVTQRTTEIGIRLALGADGRAVLRMVLRQALGSVALGLAVGVPLALATVSALRSMLFGVSPHDPATIIGACLVLITVALLAAYLPARRASNVDPLIALRYE